jgi:hypothetical protein
MNISVDIKVKDDDNFVLTDCRLPVSQLQMIMISPRGTGINATLYLSRDKIEELGRDISVFLIETSDEAAGSGG